VRLLVESGADVELLTSGGLTALQVAEGSDYTEIAEFLKRGTAS